MGNMCSSHPKTIESKIPKNKKPLLDKIQKAHTQPQQKTEINNININISINEKPTDKKTTLQVSSPEFVKGHCIGTGNIGSVYSGLSLNTGEIVAIKLIRIKSKEQIKIIKDAVKKFSELKHKNIINYMATQTSNEEEIDIILEYCNGGSIKQLLEKFDSFDEKLIKLYVKQILEGLVYLHDLGIIHRNIKNCNVLVDGNGTVKLTDFVFSDILIDDPEDLLYFNTSKLDGPFWMAPEIASRSTNITTAVDIWSVGCIIIEMATRNPPWSNIAKTNEEVYDLIINSTAPPKFPSHLSKECKSFLNCCLQKSPEKRATARELLDHVFFKVSSEQMSQSGSKDEGPKRSTGKLPATTTNIIKGPQIQLINNNLDRKDNSKIVNILTDNSGAYFSITMTVYSGHSLNPLENKLINSHILEVDEPECSPKIPESSGKKTDKIQFVFGHELPNQPNFNMTNSIEDDGFLKRLLDNKNIDLENLEKLYTLELNKEEINRIEKFFKDKQNNNLTSIGPIQNSEN